MAPTVRSAASAVFRCCSVFPSRRRVPLSPTAIWCSADALSPWSSQLAIPQEAPLAPRRRPMGVGRARRLGRPRIRHLRRVDPASSPTRDICVCDRTRSPKREPKSRLASPWVSGYLRRLTARLAATGRLIMLDPERQALCPCRVQRMAASAMFRRPWQYRADDDRSCGATPAVPRC
jgi:hypothetical protein